jgi:hypothetical protein
MDCEISTAIERSANPSSVGGVKLHLDVKGVRIETNINPTQITEKV